MRTHIKAVIAAGLPVSGVEVDIDGKVVIHTHEEAQAITKSDWDE